MRIRLLEIGEAVKALPADLLATEPTIPWIQIARMRDHLAHRHFDTSYAILQATVEHDLPELAQAVQRLGQRLSMNHRTEAMTSHAGDRPGIEVRQTAQPQLPFPHLPPCVA